MGEESSGGDTGRRSRVIIDPPEADVIIEIGCDDHIPGLEANTNQRRNVNLYFWRTYDRYELDLVEEEGGRLVGYECKWKEKRWQPPGLFSQTYPESTVHLVHRENYPDFLT